MKSGDIFKLTGVVVLFVLVIAACAPAATPDSDAAQPEGEVSEPASEEEPVVLRYGMLEEPDCIHSHYNCVSLWEVSDLLWEGFNGMGRNNEPEPRLAESVEISDDGRTFTITLHEGITWSDGEPFDANDVEEFWDWIQELSIGGWYVITRGATSWEAVDDRTFTFELADPFSGWDYSDSWWVWPVPLQEWGELDEDTIWEWSTDMPITTGPYVISEWVRGSHMILDARPEYHLGAPPVDQVVINFYTNGDAMVNALLAGEIDVIPQSLPPEFFETVSADPNVTVVQQPPGKILQVAFNVSAEGNKHPAIDDPALREAVDYAVDKQQILDVALLGRGVLCPIAFNCGPLWEWGINPSHEVTPYDPDKAAEILAEAGYTDSDGDGILETAEGEPLNFRLFYDRDYAPAETASEMLQNDLEAIGIGTEITAMESATLRDAGYNDRDFDMAVRLYQGEPDPTADDFDFTCWSAEGGGVNFWGYCDPAMDELIWEIAGTVGPERQEVVDRFHEKLAADRPLIYLAGVESTGAYRNDRFTMPHDAPVQWGMLLGWYSLMNTEPVE